jgi:hypothetical protein
MQGAQLRGKLGWPLEGWAVKVDAFGWDPDDSDPHDGCKPHVFETKTEHFSALLVDQWKRRTRAPSTTSCRASPRSLMRKDVHRKALV